MIELLGLMKGFPLCMAGTDAATQVIKAIRGGGLQMLTQPPVGICDKLGTLRDWSATVTLQSLQGRQTCGNKENISFSNVILESHQW